MISQGEFLGFSVSLYIYLTNFFLVLFRGLQLLDRDLSQGLKPLPKSLSPLKRTKSKS
jgi:hypothetical protein